MDWKKFWENFEVDEEIDRLLEKKGYEIVDSEGWGWKENKSYDLLTIEIKDEETHRKLKEALTEYVKKIEETYNIKTKFTIGEIVANITIHYEKEEK